MCTCVHVYIHTHMHTYMCVYIYIHTYICVYVCACVCMCMCTSVRVNSSTPGNWCHENACYWIYQNSSYTYTHAHTQNLPSHCSYPSGSLDPLVVKGSNAKSHWWITYLLMTRSTTTSGTLSFHRAIYNALCGTELYALCKSINIK